MGFLAAASMSPALVGQVPEQFDAFGGTPLSLERGREIRATESGEPALTAPRALLTDSSYIFVLDPAVYGVHRFDGGGRWLDTFGGEGEGPGEFRQPTAMGWVADTLWVADRRLGRLSFFDRNGTHLRSSQFRIIVGRAVIMPRRAFAGGRVVSVPYVPTQSVGDLDSLPVLVLDEGGSVRDTLAWRALGQVAVSVATSPANGDSPGPAMSIGHPFDRRSLLAYDPRGRWLYVGTWRMNGADTDHLELLQVTAAQDTPTRVSLPFARVSVSQRELRSFASRIHGGLPESFRARVSARELATAFQGQVARPSATTVDAMAASDDGTLWFRETSRTSESPPRWAGYRPGEGFVGFVEFPAGHYLLGATGGELWTVRTDELGLPTITEWIPASGGRAATSHRKQMP